MKFKLLTSRGVSLTRYHAAHAIYIVAFEVLPKTGNMTIISMLHVISFSFSWATLAVSVLSVSLYGVKTSTGVMSEHELVSAFVKADNDHSGVLDKKEVEEAVKKLGLPSAKFFKLRKKLDSLHGQSITLPVWYDLSAISIRRTVSRPITRRSSESCSPPLSSSRESAGRTSSCGASKRPSIGKM